MGKMLDDMFKISEKYNSAMNNDEKLNEFSADLINELSNIVTKYPTEIFPLMSLKTIICKSRNQTEHIKILNKMIKMSNDKNYADDLANCQKP